MAIMVQLTVRELSALLSTLAPDAPVLIEGGEDGLVPAKCANIRKVRVRYTSDRAPDVEYIEEPTLAIVLEEGVYWPEGDYWLKGA